MSVLPLLGSLSLALHNGEPNLEDFMRPLLPLFIIVALALALSGPALAGKQNKGHGKGNNQGRAAEVQTGKAIAAVITAVERSLISGYLTRNRASLPSVFANAKPLPPGLANKIARGGSMPPGIAKRFLPNNLAAQLPARPGQQWIVAGTDIVLIEAATHLIVDVLKGVL